MAFLRHRIERVHTFGAVTMEAATLSFWRYVTASTIAQVAAANYFNDMAHKQMAVGDIIDAQCSDGAQLFKVTANDGTTVTIKKTGSSKGQATTVAASDTIATGLSHVAGVVATFNDPQALTALLVSADIGNQAGAPGAGSFLLKTWKATAANDATPVAATAFGVKINWFAWGD